VHLFFYDYVYCANQTYTRLAHGSVDINRPNAGEGITPLHIACIRGHTSVVRMLLACSGIDACQARADGGSATPFRTACDKGQFQCFVFVFLCEKVSFNTLRVHVLHPNILVSRGPFYSSLLLRCHRFCEPSPNFDPNSVPNSIANPNPRPSLLLPREGHAEIVLMMLSHGGAGVTKAAALSIACTRGHTDMVKILLRK
jgi:ankyrin repeat protein